jgi:hypothetical protein
MKPIHLTNSLLQDSDYNILRWTGSRALTGICTCVFGICWERRWIIRILIPHGASEIIPAMARYAAAKPYRCARFLASRGSWLVLLHIKLKRVDVVLWFDTGLSSIDHAVYIPGKLKETMRRILIQIGPPKIGEQRLNPLVQNLYVITSMLFSLHKSTLKIKC